MTQSVSSRPRITIELSTQVSLLLDYVADVTGATKSQVINSALLDALPALLELSLIHISEPTRPY